jgi:preprotein translocase subunit SecD
VSEPQVAREGIDRIAIQLPGLQNSAEVKKILGKTATLEFRMVDENNNPLEAAATGHVPLGSKLYYTRDKQPVLLKRDVVVTGDELTDASFQPNTQDCRLRRPRQPRRGEDAEEHAREYRSLDGGGVHRSLA